MSQKLYPAENAKPAEYLRRFYVRFFSFGFYETETEVKEIEERDYRKIKVPKGFDCFLFFEVIYEYVSLDGQTIELKSRELNRSDKYFYGGKIYTVEDLKKEKLEKERSECEDYERNILWMENRKWDKLIKTTGGEFVHFGENDVLMPIKPEPPVS